VRIFLSIFFLFIALGAKDLQYDTGKLLYFDKGCNGCHGTKAEGMNTYPSLANRAEGFLAYKLKRFRAKISEKPIHDMMIPFAMGLSDKQIADLAYYLNHYVDTQTERYDIEFTSEGDGGS